MELILNGRVSKDPTLEWAKNNTLPILKFGLLVKREGKIDEFYFVKRFGEDALVCKEHIHTGDEVIVLGNLHSSSDAQKKNYYVEVIADKICFDINKNFGTRYSTESTGDKICEHTPQTPQIKVATSNVKFGRMQIPDNIDELLSGS